MNNATIETILSRRSVRDQFADRPIPAGVVEQIVRCGLAAPSSKNARPWRLHVVADRATLTALADAVATADGADTYVPIDPKTGKRRSDWPSTVAESAATLAAVPLAIFIENVGSFSRGKATLASVPNDILLECLETYTLEVIGVGAAIMNMWLAANSLGVHAAFMGDVCVADEAIAKVLSIEHDLIGVLVLGYCSEPPPRHPPIDLASDWQVVWHRVRNDPRGV